MISRPPLHHKCRITLALREVRLEIKFPCKIKLGLTLGKNETLSHEEVELTKGVATFQQHITIEPVLAYESTSKRYGQKKATLTVYVVSSRGRNVAGVIPLDLASTLNRYNHENLVTEPLQRCPDKQATVVLHIKSYFIEQVLDHNTSVYSDRSVSFKSASHKVHSITAETPNSAFRIPPLAGRLQTNSSAKYTQGSNKLLPRHPTTDEIPPSRLEHTYSEKRLTFDREQTSKPQAYRHQIKVGELQKEVDTLRRELQRRRESEKEDEGLSSKVLEYQRAIVSTRSETESASREKNREIAELSSRNEDLENTNQSLQKRVETKNNFYKEELQKYNTRLLASEGEKQQLLAEISRLKEENFDFTRSLNVMKEKERLNEDRFNLSRKSEDLKRQQSEKQIVAEYSAKDSLNERLKETISNHQVEKFGLLGQMERLKSQVVNDGVFRTKYQQELKDKNSILQEKLYLQHQHTLKADEARNEINRLNKQLMERTEEIHSLNKRVVETGARHQAEITLLREEVEGMKNQLEFGRQAEEKGRAEHEELNSLLQEMRNQLKDSERGRRDLEMLVQDLRAEIGHLGHSLFQSSEENKALNLELSRFRETLHQLENQLAQSSEDNRNMDGQHSTTIKDLQMEVKELNRQVMVLEEETRVLREKIEKQETDFMLQIERKQRLYREKEHELLKVYEAETTLQLNTVQLQAQENELRDNLRHIESELINQRSHTQSAKKRVIKLERDEDLLKQELNQLSNNYDQKVAECDHLNSENQNLIQSVISCRRETENFKSLFNDHIHTLMKCLFTKSTQNEPSKIEGLTEGLVKLELDVINKVKTCYEQLETLSYKLTVKEMELMSLLHNSNLQIQTLSMELEQMKKQLQMSHEERGQLDSHMTKTTTLLSSENVGLKQQMRGLKQQMVSEESLKSKEIQQKYNRESSSFKKEKQQYESRIDETQKELLILQKQLYQQYNETNLMNLKNNEYLDSIKELEDKVEKMLFDRMDRDSDNEKLAQEVQKLRDANDQLTKEGEMVAQREAIVSEENQFLRNQLELSSINHNENNPNETQPSEAQSNNLDIIRMLQSKLSQKEMVIRSFQENVRVLGEEVEEKYSTIYTLETEMKQLKGRLRDNSRNISKGSEQGELRFRGAVKGTADTGIKTVTEVIRNALGNKNLSPQEMNGMLQEMQGLVTELSNERRTLKT